MGGWFPSEQSERCNSFTSSMKVDRPGTRKVGTQCKSMPWKVTLPKLKMLLTMIFVFVSSSMIRPFCCAMAFDWLLMLWMKMINVAGPFVGPKGMTIGPLDSSSALKGKLLLTGLRYRKLMVAHDGGIK
jgi:hypothetical protein